MAIRLNRNRLNRDTIQLLIILTALVVLMVVFSSISPYFFSAENMLTILLTSTSVGIIAIGQFLCLLSGHFDISTGNVAALAGIIFCMFVKDFGWSVPAALALGLLFGLASGAFIGFCVAKLKANAFISTFAMMQVYRGILFVVTAGMPIAMPTIAAFRFLGTYKAFGTVQLPIVLMLIGFAGFWFVLKYTKLGRAVYCVGGNAEAARISGINVQRVTMFCFIIIGVLASFVGMLFASRVNSGQVNVGATYAMDSVAACVVGGTGMNGGKGTIWGVLLGVIIVNVLQNGLIMIGLDPSYQYIATGSIMLAAVIAQTERKKA